MEALISGQFYDSDVGVQDVMELMMLRERINDDDSSLLFQLARNEWHKVK